VTYVGVAGWDYPDWNGVVYPPRASKGFDRLAWLSRFVDCIEINTTFYRPVTPRIAASWVRRVADRPGFKFTAKAHRSWTHEPWDDPAPLIPPTLDGLSPIREAGLLGALLVQFPQSFHWNPEARARLGRLLAGLQDWPIVVEARHVSWDDDRAAAFVHDLRAGWCVVDQPKVGASTAPARPRVTSPVGYLRLHGRNTAAWFDEAAGRDRRYDYLYTIDELRPLAASAQSMSTRAQAVYAVANNHFRGQAVVAALQLKHLIQGVEPEAPPELAAVYPGLKGPERLF
jgi:uncharacterized protein YecE (DUF72 family)